MVAEKGKNVFYAGKGKLRAMSGAIVVTGISMIYAAYMLNLYSHVRETKYGSGAEIASRRVRRPNTRSDGAVVTPHTTRLEIRLVPSRDSSLTSKSSRKGKHPCS